MLKRGKVKIVFVMIVLLATFLLNGCGEKDTISVEAIDWDGNVFEGTETEFRVSVSYSLQTIDNGFIEITINDGDQVMDGYRKALVPIEKGEGKEEIIVKATPVNWDVEPFFEVVAFILDENEEMSNTYDSKDIEVSDLKNAVTFVSVEPLGNVAEGVESEYKIILDYTLVSRENAELGIGINDGDDYDSFNIKALESIVKGDGTLEFVVKTIPKEWGNGLKFKVTVFIVDEEGAGIIDNEQVLEF